MNLADMEGEYGEVGKISANFVPMDTSQRTARNVNLCALQWINRMIAVKTGELYRKQSYGYEIRNSQGARLRTLRPERLDFLYNEYFERQGTDENFEEEVVSLCQRTRKEEGTKVKGLHRLLKLVIKEFDIGAQWKTDPINVYGEVEYFSSRDRRDEVFGACREGNEWCCNGIVIVKNEDEAGKVFEEAAEGLTGIMSTIVVLTGEAELGKERGKCQASDDRRGSERKKGRENKGV